MRKIVSFILALTVLAGMSAILSACQPSDVESGAKEPTVPTPLLPETKAEIEEVWLVEHKNRPISWYWDSFSGGVRYYGTYNGAVILFEPTMLAAVTTKTIAGCEFSHGSSFVIHAYSDGKLLSLEDAYNANIISADEVAEIAEYHKNFKRLNQK